MELRPRFPGSQRPGIRPRAFALPNKASALCVLCAVVKRQPWASWPGCRNSQTRHNQITHPRPGLPIAFFADIGLREGCLEQNARAGGCLGRRDRLSTLHSSTPSMTFTIPPPLIGHGDTSRDKMERLVPAVLSLFNAPTRHKGVMSCQRSRRIHNAQPWPQCSAVSSCVRIIRTIDLRPIRRYTNSSCLPVHLSHLRPKPCSLLFSSSSLSYFIFCGLIVFCPPSPSIVRRIAWFHGCTANGMRSGLVSSSS